MNGRHLPPMEVEFYPNTGGEAGWCIALERVLRNEGWIVDIEVMTSPGRAVDAIAYLGGIVAVIEVKRIPAGPSALRQLQGYLADVRKTHPNAIGVLAAPSATGTLPELPDDVYFLPLVRA